MKAAYDLVVIGAGSGGLEAAWTAAVEYKAKVAVIDTQKEHGPPNFAALGGTCVNVGCVPKKLFVTGASYREHFLDAAGFGYDIQGKNVPFSWPKLIEAKNKAVKNINDSYVNMFKEAKMDFLQGWGTFQSQSTILLKDSLKEDGKVLQEVSFGTALVASGSWPSLPKVPGIEHCITSNEAFYLAECPDRVMVVGGGYIAVEFAGIFHSFAKSVHLVYRGPLFLRGFDTTVREELRDQMKARGVDLNFNENPAKIEKTDAGLLVTMESGKQFTVDCVMYCTGRHPRTEGLGLEKLGLTLTKSNGIAVNEFGKTNFDNIYAIGDVTDRIMLTPVAIHEGSCFAKTVFGKVPTSCNHKNIASAVFSIPTIGTVGMTEDQAAKAYPKVAIYKSHFSPLMHNLTGAQWKKFLVKVITDHASGLVIGVHLIGQDSAEIIQAVGIAVKMGAKISDFYTTIGVHPTSAEELCSMREPSYFVVEGKVVESLPPASL